MSTVPTLSESDREHRRAFRDYVLADAEPWHRKHLGRLYEDWERYNAEYFGGALEPPYILLAEPSTPQGYGDCGPVSGFGGRSQIRLRPSLLTGTHPDMDANANAAGRYAFVSDVLLHEMIHQYAQEVTGERDAGYSGHGPAFRDMCNTIGARLNLDPVRTCKKRGKDADLPSCSQWPHNVRPDPTYGGAFIQRPRTTPRQDAEQDAGETFIVPAEPEGHASTVLRLYSAADARIIAESILRTLDRGEPVQDVFPSLDVAS